MSYQLFWGDLHSHCSISYGHGTVEQALARARQQLDFCSITGHAFWPDMPTDRSRYAEIIDYHTEGFGRLARNWDKLLAAQKAATVEGEFVVFPSYEWHSLRFGDHNVYSPGPDLPLADAPDLPTLRQVIGRVEGIAVPHHIGYRAGYRGIDWNHFREEQSPFVEIFSLHGCSLSEEAPFPMLHDMGPRDAQSTAEAGWQRGLRFGIVGGTDHHGAYPGSHGDGRMGVFSGSLTRQDLWEAFQARRVFAATGDRIDARLFVDDAWIGSVVQAPGRRRLRVEVDGRDRLACVNVLRNGRIVRRLFPNAEADTTADRRHRLRIAWGWGPKDRVVAWNFHLRLTDGTITDVETCFSGQPIVAPKPQQGDEEVPDDIDLPHAVTERSDRRLAWRSLTIGNPTMRHSTVQEVSLEIKADDRSRIVLETGGHRFEYSLAELRQGGRTHYLEGWLSQAVRIGPAVPVSQCRLQAAWDEEPEQPIDRYRLEVAQVNGQWAWLSPIWVER